jgi:hypothetical protein
MNKNLLDTVSESTTASINSDTTTIVDNSEHMKERTSRLIGVDTPESPSSFTSLERVELVARVVGGN